MQRRSSSAQTAQDAIKEYMLRQGLHPGDPMPTENELCERLGVSRSSVREAMRTLAALDIVEVRHDTGTFVGKLSLAPLVNGLAFRNLLSPRGDYATLREVVEVRTAVDLGLADALIPAPSGTRDARLHDLVAEMVSLSEAGQPFLDADRAFHATLLAHLPNRLLGQLVDVLWDVHTQVLPRLGVATPDDIEPTAAAHGAMLAAAERGDVEAYREAVLAHYQPLLQVLEHSGDGA